MTECMATKHFPGKGWEVVHPKYGNGLVVGYEAGIVGETFWLVYFFDLDFTAWCESGVVVVGYAAYDYSDRSEAPYGESREELWRKLNR